MSPNCRCIPCDFNCNAGKWYLDGQANDCYGCDGSGLETQCDACFGPECTSEDCDTRTMNSERDSNGLPFCAGCFEELKKEMEEL